MPEEEPKQDAGAPGASTTVLVPVLREQKIRSWPKYPSGGRAEYVSIAAALGAKYHTDAHTAAYSVPTIGRRLSLDALRKPEARSQLSGGVAMVVAIFDIDCSAAHEGDASGVDAWWLDEVVKVEGLLAAHPRGFVYRTRGGYRVVYLLSEPCILRDDADAEAWSARYCGWVAYMHREFEITADVACRDWTRLYRLPCVTRDEGGKLELREILGDAAAIGTWTCDPSVEDLAEARKLKRRRIPKERFTDSGGAPEFVAVGDGLLAHAFRARGLLGDQTEPGKWVAVCPNQSAHTKGEGFDGSTVLYAPSPGEEVGWLHCSHAHCQGRTVRDALAMFSEIELDEARRTAGLAPRNRGKIGETEPDEGNEEAGSDEPKHGPPRIECGTDLHANANAAEEALAEVDTPRIYVRARALSICTREFGPKIKGVRRESGAPFVLALELPALREHLSRAADWYTWNERKGEWKQCLPPGPVVAALAARGSWPDMPPLSGIVEVPTMRSDGSVLERPGYDESSGLLFEPRGIEFPKIPEDPTRAEIERAVEHLREPFLDFEWERTEVDLPVTGALILTFPARPLFEGPSPCFCFDSTTRGSGKGLACDAAVIAGSGRRPAVSIFSTEAEEQRKALFSLTLESHRAVLLDNITRPLGGAVLSAVLTSGEIRDRVLGESRTATAKFDAVIVATGNNLRFMGDFDRRVLVARQAPSVENPEDREPTGGFRHPNLREWIFAEYPKLVASALTILRGYFRAGCPSHGLKPLGSFESWDAIVRGACIWAGIGDPLACRERIREGADDDRERIQGLLAPWYDAFGATPATVAQAIERSKSHETLQHALAEFDSKGTIDRPNATSIGRRLRSIVGRIVGGKRLVRVGTQSPVLYRIEVLDGTGLGGLEGVDPAASVTPAHTRARAYSEPAEEPPASPSTPWWNPDPDSPQGCECAGDRPSQHDAEWASSPADDEVGSEEGAHV